MATKTNNQKSQKMFRCKLFKKKVKSRLRNTLPTKETELLLKLNWIFAFFNWVFVKFILGNATLSLYCLYNINYFNWVSIHS